MLRPLATMWHGKRVQKVIDMTDDRHRAVVVYDGDCSFCCDQIDRIRARDRWQRFEFLPRATPDLDERFPQITEGDFNAGMRLITPGGKVHIGADATYEIARELPFWRRIAWIYRLPVAHAVAKSAYAWIAKNRRSLSRSGANGTCTTSPRQPRNNS